VTVTATNAGGTGSKSVTVTITTAPGIGRTVIALGTGHTCALTATGGVKCWGANGSGQLGDGTTTARTIPVDVSGLTSGVAAIAAGDSHSCALTTAGSVKCWGMNFIGQLGDGTTTARTIPVDVSGLTSGVAAIAAGSYYTCALTATGGVKCWGANNQGQLGDNSAIDATPRTIPVDVSGLTSGVAAIAAAGQGHTCALTTAGGVKCWGSNQFGELGDNTTTTRTTPIDVSGLTSGVAAIAGGQGHTCALTTAGGVKCWGWNDNGQLGDTTTTTRTTPVDVSGLTSGVAAIAAGDRHTCALTTAGGVKCWGWNNLGQLGDTTTTTRTTPVDVSGLSSGIAAIATGVYHSCALTTAGGVKCWGYNGYGQLGDNTTINRTTPVDVLGFIAAFPNAPTIGTATAGNASISVGFTPGAPGSGTLINYTADCGGVTNTGGSSPITVTGLTNGTSYTCKVKTTTTVGPSAWSANSNSVTPSAPTLSVSKVGTGAGTVTSAPAGINCGATCGTSFTAGTTVTLTATPATGSSFTGWSGACNSSGQVTLDADKTCTATFNLITYTLTASKAGTGSGTVTSSLPGINCGATCGASFTAGTAVTLTATPATGSTFAGWSGACNSSGQVTLDADKTCTATFAIAVISGACGSSNGGTFTTAPTTNLCSAGTPTTVSGSGPWTWSCTGSNGGTPDNCSAILQTQIWTVTPSPGAGGTINPSTPVTVNNGSTTTFTVIPNNGYTASVGGTCGGNLNGTTFTTNAITANCTVSATFTTITTVILQPGPGQGKDIWTTSVYSYAPGGGGPGGGLDDDQLRVGGFGDLYYSLLQFNLSGLPNHANAVVLRLYNNDRNPSPTGMYLDRIGQPWSWVDRLWWADKPATTQWRTNSLPAPALNAWYEIDITDLYNGWQGGAFPNYGLQLRPTQNNNNYNSFYSSDYLVDPTLRPMLIITPDTTAINGVCGSSNGGTFTAAPATNLCSSGTPTTISGSGPWSWSCLGSNGGASATCTANLITYTLTVSKAGTGGGTVTSSPTGITCGADCSESYASGTPVTLTATPATGSSFTGWSGACAGSGTVTTCTITLDAAKSVTATFVTRPDLVVTAVTNPPGTARPGGSFSVTATVKNQGLASAGSSTVRYYLSLDGVQDTGDKLLSGSRSVASLATGASSTGTVTVTIPSSTVSGTYFLLACADDTKVVAESNEGNNCRSSNAQIRVGP
jgi:alpha-tubulin suppressor-like RCC1 family protein